MSENYPHLHLGPISSASPGPLYQQIVDAFKREVAAGRLLPGSALPSFRALAEELLVSLITIGFFAYMTWLFWRYVAIVGNERMVTVNLPRGIVFYAVLAAFALMLIRAIQVFVTDWRRGGGPRLDEDDKPVSGA